MRSGRQAAVRGHFPKELVRSLQRAMRIHKGRNGDMHTHQVLGRALPLRMACTPSCDTIACSRLRGSGVAVDAPSQGRPSWCE